jgi:hypothetical protein
MQIKRIAIQHPYSGVAENQSAARIIAAAAIMGIEARELRDSADIIDFDPDFVLSISHMDPKLTPYPTYGVMTGPSAWYELPRLVRNILTYDAYLTVTPGMKEWLSDLTFGARKTDTPIGFYFNTVLPYDGGVPECDYKNASLMYVGTNWDGGRHNDLFSHLAESKFFLLYGPKASWEDYPDRYEGSLPFDSQSLLEAYRQAGVGLCIEHAAFIEEGMPSNRIFETLAAGALAICARTDFNKKWFGDSVLYVDMDRPSRVVAKQVTDHMAWIRNNPQEAREKAHTSHKKYCETFALDKMLRGICDMHEQVAVAKGYVPFALPDPAPKVGVIIRAGSRGKEFLNRSIGSAAGQTYQNLKVYIVLWKQPADLGQVMAMFPDLNYEIVEEPNGNRSTCEWRGLTVAKEDGCDLIGILDDDDEYHPNMAASLVRGYSYHRKLAFDAPITMVAGGSLIAHPKPQMNFSEFETRNAIARPETRYIQHFHFGNSGQVNDRSYGYSQCALFFVANYLDQEVLQNPNMDIIEDWMIWLQMAERGRTVFVPEVVATVHEHEIDRAGYKGKTEATFRNHARIGRRMFGRHFKKIEHYEAPNWLNHAPIKEMMATWISYPAADNMPGAETVIGVDDTIATQGADLTLLAGYSELVAYVDTAGEIPTAPFKLQLTTSQKDVSLRIATFELDLATGLTIARAKFFVTQKEQDSPVTLKLKVGESCPQAIYVDAQVRQMADTGNLTYVKYKHLYNYEKVWLYGASKLGEMALNILDTEGLQPAGIADTFRKEPWQNYSVLGPEDLKSALGANDAIVISSQYWWEISNDLMDQGISNHIFVIKEQSSLATVFQG